MWVVASTGDTPRSGRAAADPPGLCGLCRRPGLPSCCRAGTGTVSSERFPSRGLRIMHLEQHSLIQVCDLSENQIPVISPAIWPPPTRGRPGGRGAAAGSGRGAPCPSRASPAGRTERAVGPWGGRRQPGKEMPQEAFLGGRAGPGELSPLQRCPCAPVPHTSLDATTWAGPGELKPAQGYSCVPAHPWKRPESSAPCRNTGRRRGWGGGDDPCPAQGTSRQQGCPVAQQGRQKRAGSILSRGRSGPEGSRSPQHSPPCPSFPAH